MVIAAIAFIMFLYSFVFQGHIANTAVRILEHFFFDDYETALYVYNKVVRNYIDVFFVILIVSVFIVLMRIYLNKFSKYFKEINRGIDLLLSKEEGGISLPSELLPVEKKLNSVKNTLEKQSNDIQIAEQRKNDLIMYLAHDLKTPLASVIGYINLLRDSGEIAPELREKYLSISLEKAQRLEDLINEFFEIARYNLSHITLQYSKINLSLLFEQLIYEFKPMLDEKNLSCSLSITPNLYLRCDADKLQRVFDNLLRNAVIYSFDGSGINIIVTEHDRVLLIRFINRGYTIAKDKMNRIFEQFYRLDSSRNTASAGAGLGLAIAKQIVELHGGNISAKSENDIIEFDVILPVS